MPDKTVTGLCSRWRKRIWGLAGVCHLHFTPAQSFVTLLWWDKTQVTMNSKRTWSGAGPQSSRRPQSQQLERKGGTWQTVQGFLDSLGGRIREICFMTVIVTLFSWETWRTEAAVVPQNLDVWQTSAGKETAGFGSHFVNRPLFVQVFGEGLNVQLLVQNGWLRFQSPGPIQGTTHSQSPMNELARQSEGVDRLLWRNQPEPGLFLLMKFLNPCQT